MDQGKDFHQDQKRGLRDNLKGCLGCVLPFIIVIFIPIIIFIVAVIILDDTDLNTRQSALEANWELFLDRSNTLSHTIDEEKFELTLCPFEDDGSWEREISPEEAGLVCGNVTVPLFHENPLGETIQIPVAIWPYSGEPISPYPLFISQGGPGGSTLEMYPNWLYSNSLREKRDLVFVDQRGTGYAEPSLICPENTTKLYGTPLDNENLETDYLSILKYCRARLTGKGIDLAAFTTPQIAGDFEFVRQVFGFYKMDFYGVSYGTQIGQYLAAQYPENIKTLILDGVAPIPLDYLNQSISSHNRVLNELILSCDQNPTCNDNYPDLLNTLRNTLNRLDQEPTTIKLRAPLSIYSQEINLSGQVFYNLLLRSFFYDHSYAALPYVLHQSEQGRFDYLISKIGDPSLGYQGAPGLFYSVVCAEHTTMTDLHENDSDLIPVIKIWENNNLEDNRDECKIWNVARPSGLLEGMAESRIPTLLLSGQFDPVTPPEFGEVALKSFPRGQHIIDPLGSHGVAFTDDCTDEIMEAFLERPTELINTECLFDPNRRQQIVPRDALSSPVLGKPDWVLESLIILPVCMILLMILRSIALGLRAIWRKVRKIQPNQSTLIKQVRRRFELASWVFVLCNLGLVIGMVQYLYELFELPSYLYALAFPEAARGVLIIPILLLIILPILIISVIRAWKHNKYIFVRVYYLLFTLYSGVVVIILASQGLLVSWAR